MASTTFNAPPPPVPGDTILLSFPAKHVLLVTLNRPAQRNAVNSAQHAALAAIWDWYDSEPSLRCAIITGAGDAAFCAGADLKEWDSSFNSATLKAESEQVKQAKIIRAAEQRRRNKNGGFGGLSNRGGKKPVIAAVNGLCLGGGFEMAINCDLVIAEKEKSKFGLPEVTIGVVAVAGALPRLVQVVGRQRASEMAFTGRIGYSAETMREWGMVNEVVEGGGEAVVKRAVQIAKEICGNSPDAVLVSREGILLGLEGLGAETATEICERGLYAAIDQGENMREGVKSFVERRKPVWKDSKL